MTTPASAAPNPFGARATLSDGAWTARIYRLDALPKAGLPDPLLLDYRFGLSDTGISSLAIGLSR